MIVLLVNNLHKFIEGGAGTFACNFQSTPNLRPAKQGNALCFKKMFLECVLLTHASYSGPSSGRAVDGVHCGS